MAGIGVILVMMQEPSATRSYAFVSFFALKGDSSVGIWGIQSRGLARAAGARMWAGVLGG